MDRKQVDFGREKEVFPLVLIQVKSAAKRTVFDLKNKREKTFLPFKTQLFHIQVVRYAASGITGWRNPLGRHTGAWFSRRIFFWPVSMRRRSLRLLSPGTFPNSDGNTGAFFRAENYRREFFVRKPEAWTWKVSSSELPSQRDLVSEAWLRMVVYGRIWKNYPLNENAHLFSAMVIIFWVPLH